jgi:hypothetical protein
MRKFIKKVSAIAASALMVGLSMGTAMAASVKSDFTSTNTAIVIGSGSGVSVLDTTTATVVKDYLGTEGGSIVVEGGESFALDKSSDHFNFNNTLNALYTTLDGDELDFLEDGDYDDGDIDTPYSQKITLGNHLLSLFADSDYEDKDPTIGFYFTNGGDILNYTMDFDETVNTTLMEGTDLPLLGRNYYVLNAVNDTSITLLDTADSQVLNEGVTATVQLGEKTYTIEVAVFDDGARFTLNGGEFVSNKLDDGEYQKISGTDTYVIAKSVDYVSKDSGTSQVEFSLGQGKIELIDGKRVKLNDDYIDGITTDIEWSSNKVDKITLAWTSDEETFLTESKSISMPLFGAIQVAYGGLNFPSDSEKISLDDGETLTLNMGNYDIPIAWVNDSGYAHLGEEDHELKLAATSYTYADLGVENNTTPWWGSVAVLNTTNASTSAINVTEGDRVLVTVLDTDLTDIETAYYEVSSIDVDDADTWTVSLDDLIGSDDVELKNEITDTDSAGDITVGIAGFDSTNTSVLLEFSMGINTVTYNKVVSEKGMIVTLPSSGFDGTAGSDINFTEANKDGDIGGTGAVSFTATVKNTSNTRLHVSTHSETGSQKEESDEHYVAYVKSDLASKITFDTGSDEYDFSIDYYGKEVTADVQVVTGGTVSYGEGVGAVIVKDSEINTVGSSCINSVAANLLGSNYCGSDFTSNTGVGSGQFLIKKYSSPYTTGKFALLVAGYEAADTTNAGTYLTTQNVDTDKVYKGTSATTAELVTTVSQ